MRAILGCAAILCAAACTSTEPDWPRPMHPLNVALVQFLGEPVEMPPGMDDAYTSQRMQAALRDACGAMGITVRKLIADDSEFPVVLGGTLESDAGSPDLEAIVLAAGPEKYVYSGSHTWGGSIDGVHYKSFAMTIVPRDTYPVHASIRIERRSSTRLDRVLAQLR